MAKTSDNRTKITFDYEGKTYTLVYSADALKKMEKNYGVKFADLSEQIITMPENLFHGAFITNHPDVSRNKRTEIYKALAETVDGGEDTLVDVLIEMISEAIEDMKPKGNVTWKVERKA